MLSDLFSVGQEEELSYIVYGTDGVLKLRNWSELSTAHKDSTFEILTSFDTVKTFVEDFIELLKKKKRFFFYFCKVLKYRSLLTHF